MKKILAMATLILASLPALAEEAATAVATTATASSDKGMLALASALAISVAVFAGTFAQGKAASSALEGLARNPAASDKMFTPFILSLALIESLVILAFLVSFIKIGGLL